MPTSSRLDARDEPDRLKVADTFSRFSDAFADVSDEELERELAKAQAEVRAEMDADRTTKQQPSIDFRYPIEGSGDIPTFHDIDEEADFWDTHEVMADGAGGWSVRLIDPTELDDRIVVRLGLDQRDALVEQAQARNMEPSALAAAWLGDRLRLELEKAS